MFQIVAAASGLVACFSSSVQAAGAPGTWRGQSITEFDGKDGIDWQVVNDGVMGGLSKGNLAPVETGTMKFSGMLSMENNGGFSTFRSGDVDLNLSNDLGLLLRVKGDGRTYQARLATDARYRGMEVSFAADFSTVKDEWLEVKVPFAEFKGSFRGTDLPKEVLDPSMIRRVSVLLADKKQGSFDIEIDYMRTYGKGQGKYTERAKKPSASERTASAKAPARLIETAVADGRFTTFKKALDAAGLTVFFQWDKPLTVFAPTDEAFAKLPEGVLQDLLKPENKSKLIALLSHHVSAGANGLADTLKAGKVDMLQGGSARVAFTKGKIRINEAAVIDGDVPCQDGVIHVIDRVLLPPSKS